MRTAVAASAVPQETAATRAWEKIGNALVLLAYSCIVLFTVGYHEKWADEAQAWLIARDLDLKTIWFNELRYEGSPGLWHTILWIAQHVFHLPYATLGYIGVVFAIMGVAVLVYKAPFPWYIRWPLAFTYVMVYQYAVIARPYTILPLLCFLVAIFFKDVEHPVRMTVVLVLLANLSLHGTLLAASFGLLYLIEAIKHWPTFDDKLRNRYFICAAVMALTFIFIVIVLRPTPDNEEYVTKKETGQLSDAQKQEFNIVSPGAKAVTILCGAFLDFLAPSAAFLLLAAVWCYRRHRFLLFVLPVGLMIGIYSGIHGYAHHHGTAFIATITALWIAWPTEQDRQAFSVPDRWALHAMVAALLCLCAVNIWDAAVAVKREYLYPYSGAENAASYLKSVGADHETMFGIVYGVAAVQAYFDHNVFANMPAAYYHHGLPLIGRYLNVDELRQVQPEYVVVYSVDPSLYLMKDGSLLPDEGYQLAHFSDGYYLYKRAVYQRETYFIYRRIHPTSGQTPQTLNPDKQAGSADRR
jgi:hypothetical protein